MSVRLSTAKRRPLDACPFEARQKICQKITNSKPDRIIAIGSVRTQASARLRTGATNWSEALFVTDFEAVLYHGGFFADLATRLRELAKACRAHGYFVVAQGAYPTYRTARGHGHRNPAGARSGRNPAFRRCVHQERRVRFCPSTIDKMAIHPVGAALSFKADDPVDAALQGAFRAAISLKFDHQLSSRPKLRA